MSVIVELKRFSGPMDLLLYLIRKEEMDIFDINIHEITQQYLDSIKQMKKLDLEAAGDFIAMAATLIQIKAKMLVPQYNEDGEIVEEEDPRKDLVKKLLEYQMYKEAGQTLYERPLLGRDMLVRGRRENLEQPDGEIIMEEDNALYALIAAYRTAVRRMNRAVHKVSHSLKSIRERILEIRERLQMGHRVLMSELLNEPSEDPRGTKLITFLSLLELAKIGLVSLFQSENFEDIHIETKQEISETVLTNVESYEAHHTDAEMNWTSEVEMNLADDEIAEMESPAQVVGAQMVLAEHKEEEQLAEAATDEEIEEALLEEEKLNEPEL